MPFYVFVLVLVAVFFLYFDLIYEFHVYNLPILFFCAFHSCSIRLLKSSISWSFSCSNRSFCSSIDSLDAYFRNWFGCNASVQDGVSDTNDNGDILPLFGE
eukprot:UN29951